MKNLSISEGKLSLVVAIEDSPDSFVSLKIDECDYSPDYCQSLHGCDLEYYDLDMCICAENAWPYANFGGPNDDSCIGVMPTLIVAYIPLREFRPGSHIAYNCDVNGKRFSLCASGDQFIAEIKELDRGKS